MELLSRRLPRQESELARNDRKFEFAMTGKSATRHRTTERYRAAQGRNDYTNLPHDLAARPAGNSYLYTSALNRHVHFYHVPGRREFAGLSGSPRWSGFFSYYSTPAEKSYCQSADRTGFSFLPPPAPSMPPISEKPTAEYLRQPSRKIRQKCIFMRIIRILFISRDS